MNNFLKSVLYLSSLVSIFAFASLIVLFNDELTFKNIVLSFTPVLLSYSVYKIYLKDFSKSDINQADEYQEGDVVNLFADMPWSKHKNKYSEGVFFWCEGGSLLTELEFHLERGGDPDVFHEWLEQEKNSPRFLKPVLH